MAEFSDNIVNQRFVKVFDTLFHDRKIKGKSDVAVQLETYNHVVNNILVGKRKLTIDQIHRLCDVYGINANYLFGRSNHIYAESINNGSEMRSSTNGNIVMVNAKALAGYGLDVIDADADAFKRFSMPGMHGELIAIEVSGDSMYPTLSNGDILICAPLERGIAIEDNAIYVVVSDVVVAKRVQAKRIEGKVSELLLLSDNSIFQPYSVAREDVKQLLKVKCRVTAAGLK